MKEAYEKYKTFIQIAGTVIALISFWTGIVTGANAWMDSRIEKKLDVEVWQKKMFADSVKTANQDYKDSILQAQARYRDSLELVFKHKYTGLLEANISPANK